MSLFLITRDEYTILFNLLCVSPESFVLFFFFVANKNTKACAIYCKFGNLIEKTSYTCMIFTTDLVGQVVLHCLSTSDHKHKKPLRLQHKLIELPRKRVH